MSKKRFQKFTLSLPLLFLVHVDECVSELASGLLSTKLTGLNSATFSGFSKHKISFNSSSLNCECQQFAI